MENHIVLFGAQIAFVRKEFNDVDIANIQVMRSRGEFQIRTRLRERNVERSFSSLYTLGNELQRKRRLTCARVPLNQVDMAGRVASAKNPVKPGAPGACAMFTACIETMVQIRCRCQSPSIFRNN